ncbi:protein kinase family protein [Bacillus sp. BHET2]|uniref:protein kinase domain-containing protein n=1 Tax=Bacillus sp. BHET2 TaxID=2583818 RepID=UPI00110ED5A8|nr:serine/threonine-protein kinase [Bacillus sp. BHET2]TMU82966.1 protein kinase family protein [Bacillus sp. BHET2]
MMNNTSKKPFSFTPGTVIRGKWYKHIYTIVKELGYGANGIVYLVQGSSGYQALKMSDSNVSITSEVNVLKAFSKVQGSPLGPKLLDVDDWDNRGQKIHFYVMEYIQGTDLLSFVQSKGFSWAGVLVAQLLTDLERIHKEGWVFGDLKPENLIVTGPPYRIRCIDVGGTTINGRAIKEFTEFFDRGYWIGGSRRAEPSYDLFSVGMILINLAYPSRFTKTGNGNMQQLRQAIGSKSQLKKFEGTIVDALEENFQSANEMRVSLLNGLSHSQQMHQPKPKPKAQRSVPQSSTVRTATPNPSRYQNQRKQKSSHFLETVLVVMIVSLLYVLYIYGELM